MGEPPKILLIDDEREFLKTYEELLVQLPSKPEVRSASSGTRAIAMLDAEPFGLVICDLKMAHMDGFQVLAIVRRRFPQLRTVVITGLADEQFRARAYSMGVDLFLQKPTSPDENKLFFECIESLFGKETTGGFRGVQSKSLVDIIQLECLSQSSSVLKIVQGVQEGKIWFTNGEIFDATTADLAGETAFQKILSWKTGNFEVLPADPERARAIYTSYHSLLLETAQRLDETDSGQRPPENAGAPSGNGDQHANPLIELSKFRGVEFILASEESGKFEAWGVENADEFSTWTRTTMDRFHKLGESLKLGQLTQIEGATTQRHIALVSRGACDICVGMQRSMSLDQVRQTLKNILAKWAY